MSETVLIDAATVAAGAPTDVVAHFMAVPGIQFRVVCDNVYTARFYVADEDFTDVADAAELDGTADVEHAATTGLVYDVDPGAYDYVACVVTNEGVDDATVTVATGYELVAQAPTALFTVAEARAFVHRSVTPLADTSAFTDAAIIAEEAAVRELFTQACRIAFIPTEATETLDGNPSRVLRLGRHNPLREHPQRPVSVSAASIDGVALTATELENVKAYPSGRLARVDGASWTSSTGYQELAVEVTYVHGWASVPEQIKTAALLLMTRHLVGSDVPDEAVSFTDGGASYQFPRPGQAPHWTGYDAVDAVLRAFEEDRVRFG